MSSDGEAGTGKLVPQLWSTAELTPDELQVVQEAKDKSGRKRFQRGLCFRNAQQLTLSSNGRLAYAEGVVGTGTHHAWNVINGKAVDVTLKGRTPVFYLGVVVDKSMVAERWANARPGSWTSLAFLGKPELATLRLALEARGQDPSETR